MWRLSSLTFFIFKAGARTLVRSFNEYWLVAAEEVVESSVILPVSSQGRLPWAKFLRGGVEWT
jgi:hypothetical protein